jgi:hypothetical protein
MSNSANREKQYCPAGHPYNEANTYITRQGKRECRECHRIRMWRRRHGHTEARPAGAGRRGPLPQAPPRSLVPEQPRVAQPESVKGPSKPKRYCPTAEIISGVERLIRVIGRRIGRGETDGTGEDDLGALLLLAAPGRASRASPGRHGPAPGGALQSARPAGTSRASGPVFACQSRLPAPPPLPAGRVFPQAASHQPEDLQPLALADVAFLALLLIQLLGRFLPGDRVD